MRRAFGAGAAALLLAATVTACTGVPRTSAPHVIKPVGVLPSEGQPAITPPRGADPRSIVSLFLDANAANDLHHNAARAFLTPEAKNRWSDSTVTVIDSPRVGNVGSGARVTVQGQQIGTIDAFGTYTPSLQGNGSSAGLLFSRSFGIKQVRGQWRIDALQNGLVISMAQFQRYQQRVVYFYDLAEQHLVPDPRYSELTDAAALTSWLIARLADGPRDVLQNAETTELPAQTDPKRVTADVGAAGRGAATLTTIEIPGAAQLGPANRNRLATQVAVTLSQVDQVEEIEITDGSQPVQVPKVGGAIFTASSVGGGGNPAPSDPALFYVHNGGVVGEDGKPLAGRVGNGAYGLRSVALADRGGTSGFLVAGVRGPASASQLDIGSVGKGLIATTVHGQLSRPAWAPGEREVWIGDGPLLYRVTGNASARVVPVNAASGKASGRVTALRISPDGSRVAIVLANPDASAQLWVGTIVRGSGVPRVVSLAPISPQGVIVTDVGWNDELKLFAIGRDARTADGSVYEVQCDGSLWTQRGIGNLPVIPDSITVTENAVASVSAGGTVWKQQAGAWESLQGDETRGSDPVYVQ